MAVHKFAKKLGTIIRAHRKFQDISVNELAEMAGLSRDVVSKFESGRRGIRLDTFIKLAFALQLSFTIGPKTTMPDPAKPTQLA